MTKITARTLCAGPMIVRAHACVLGSWLSRIAPTRNGIARNRSVKRIRRLSSQPP